MCLATGKDEPARASLSPKVTTPFDPYQLACPAIWFSLSLP